MKHRIFWTCVLPEHLIARYGLSFAACNFSFNLMSDGAFDRVYSILPLYVGGKMQQEAFDDNRFELVYDKWREKGGVWKKLATFKEQFVLFRKIPKEASVWFYNLNTLDALLYLSRLSPESTNLEVLKSQVDQIVEYFGMLSAYDDSENPYDAYPSTTVEQLRNDAIVPGLDIPDVRKISDEFLDGYFRVPKVLGEGA